MPATLKKLQKRYHVEPCTLALWKVWSLQALSAVWYTEFNSNSSPLKSPGCTSAVETKKIIISFSLEEMSYPDQWLGKLCEHYHRTGSMCDGDYWCQSKECFNLLRQIRISRKCYEACKHRKRSQINEEISTDQINKEAVGSKEVRLD